MAEYNELVQAIRYLVLERLQQQARFVHGLLGDGQGRVAVPGRPDYSYVRPNRSTNVSFEVFNKEVAGPDGWPVLIGELPWQPGLTQVVGSDWAAYNETGWGSNAALVGPHARQHEWPDTAPGTDPLNVYRRSLAEMKTYPVGSGSQSVYVSPYDYDYGVPRSWPGLPGLDLAAAAPATGTARLMLTYLDPASNAIGAVTGSVGVYSDAVDLPRPTLPTGTWFPSAYVRLYGGQSTIRERDIRDARRLFSGGMATGTASGGAPSGPAGGDLTGTYPDPTVDGLQGRSLLSTAPNEGEVLTWTGSAWRPWPTTARPPTGPAGGDLTGTYPDPRVAGLFGYPLMNTLPAEGNVLMFTGSAWRPSTYQEGGGWPFSTATVDLIDPDADFSSIQDGVDSIAAGGFIVLHVAPGVYVGNLTITNRNVSIIGMGRDTRNFAGLNYVAIDGNVAISATANDVVCSLENLEVAVGAISVFGQVVPSSFTATLQCYRMSMLWTSTLISTSGYAWLRLDECWVSYGAGTVISLNPAGLSIANVFHDSFVSGTVNLGASAILEVVNPKNVPVTAGAGTVRHLDKLAGRWVLGETPADKDLVTYVAGSSRFEFSPLPGHVHTAAAGQGGQLDWDDVWTDAVHSHASAAEGGLLPGAGVEVYKSTDTALAADTVVYLSFDNEVRDDANFWDGGSPTRFTVPAGYAGWYMISGVVNIAASSSVPEYRQVLLRLDGATFIGIQNIYRGTIAAANGIASTLQYLTAGQYVELGVQCHTAGTSYYLAKYGQYFRMIRVA